MKKRKKDDSYDKEKKSKAIFGKTDVFEKRHSFSFLCRTKYKKPTFSERTFQIVCIDVSKRLQFG